MAEDSAAVQHKINQEVGVDDESVGEKVTSNNENKSKKGSKSEAKPPVSPAIHDLTTGDFIIDKVGRQLRVPCTCSLSYHGTLKASKYAYLHHVFGKVFVIVSKATFKGGWFGQGQYSVSVEVINGGCGPASIFTSSTVDGADTVINESSLILYKRVNKNGSEEPKLRISVCHSLGKATRDSICIWLDIPHCSIHY